jgi:serine/threonine protein kinase
LLPALQVGQRFGVYSIVEKIGVGGMGEVYRARDPKLGRDVALKVLPASLASDPGRLARFDREARVLASLSHPNIATIHGIEDAPTETGGHIRAIVMELVDGDTLATRLERGPIPRAEAIAIARQIASALDAAHERAIVHRDLKPANIAITRDDVVKVLDFGLAKATSGDGAVADLTHSPTITIGATQEGVILGTAAYMSPEQARGRVVDKRADIWAFGCVVYEMLTGRVAFAGETVSDTIARILQTEPEWPAEIREAPQLWRLLVRCLEKDPKRRLRDIGEVPFLLEAPVAVSQDGHIAPQRPNAPTRRRAFTIGGLVLIVVVGLLAALLPKWLVSAPGLSGKASPSQLTNLGEHEWSGALSPDGSSFAFVSNHGGRSDIWLRQTAGGDPSQVTDDPETEDDLVWAADGESLLFARTERNEATRREQVDIWRVGVRGGPPREPQKVVANAWLPAPSPDGKSLAYYQNDEGQGWKLVVKALDGSKEMPLVRKLVGGRSNPRPAWSPDGRSIAYCRNNTFAARNLFVVDSASGVTHQVTNFTRSLQGIKGSAWLPDNRHLVVTYTPSSKWLQPNDVGIVDVRDGSISRATMSIGDSFEEPSVSRDGSRVLVTSVHDRHELWRVPLDGDQVTNGGKATLLIDNKWEPMWSFLSRDGRTVLFNSPWSGSRNLWTMPVAGGERRQVTSLPESAISHSSLSPDGKRLAFVSNATGDSKIWTQNIDGSDLRQLTNGSRTDGWPVWSPDGQWIVFNSIPNGGTNETWRIRPNGEGAEKLFDAFFRGDWAPRPGDTTGTWLVTISDGLQLFDVERRTQIWKRPGAGDALPQFSPDGRSISSMMHINGAQDAVVILDALTGKARVAATLPFRITFRAAWADDGQSVVVNRVEQTSHIVMFDHFWEAR